MKAELQEPKVEKNVVITMTETEAKYLKALLGRFSKPIVSDIILKSYSTLSSNVDKIYETTVNIYNTLDIL